MTNGEKFKEVFGFKPTTTLDCEVVPDSVCDEQRNIHADDVDKMCSDCPFNGFWDKEYKECFCIKEEYENNESVAEMLNKKKMWIYEKIVEFLAEAEKQSKNYDGGGVELIDWCRMMICRSERFRDKEDFE